MTYTNINIVEQVKVNITKIILLLTDSLGIGPYSISISTWLANYMEFLITIFFKSL